MNKIKMFLALLISSISLFFSCGSKEPFYAFDGKALTIKADSGVYTIQAYTKQVIKVNFTNQKTGVATTSHAAVLPEASGIATITAFSDSSVTLSTGEVSVKISKNPFSISFLKNEEIALKGASAFVSDTCRGFRFELQEGESIYGGGERAVPMNRRGYRFELYNAPHYGYEFGAERLNYSLPLLASSNKYMLLFDNPQKGYMDIGKTHANKLELGAIGGNLDCYFIGGDSFATLCEQYTALTGRQDLPPRWAFGYLLSRFGYKTQQETVETVAKMEQAGFPIEAVILDLFWFGEEIQGTLGNLDWHAPNWPDPKKMIDDFKAKNIQTILITEPFIVKTSSTYQEADNKKIMALDGAGNTFVDTAFYFGNGGLIDIFKPEAQDWFWAKYKKQIDMGVGAWWGDLGEPERHPEGMIHVNGKADEVHNIYGHYWDKMLYERYAQEYPDTRLFNLNRSGFAGSQRYSIFPWTGDVSRSWGGLKAQIPLMLTMGMSGLGYIHSDLGGFSPNPKNEELYIRWLQMGVFNPIFRPHSATLPSEPIYYSKPTENIVKDLVALRYRMLPYNYSMAWQNMSKGMPLARPTFFAHDDAQLKDSYDTYMWGDNLLVYPVIEGGQETAKVYLPEGHWFDFWTDEAQTGGQTVDKALTLTQIPVWVKAGAFIPMANMKGNMGTYDPSELTLHYYPHASVPSSTFEMYEDDGQTRHAYKKANYHVATFSGAYSESGIEVTLAQSGAGYQGAPESRSVTLVLHQIEAPKTTTVAGQVLTAIKSMEALNAAVSGVYWDDAKKCLYAKFDWTGVDMKISAQ